MSIDAMKQALEALTQIASCAIGTDFGREFRYQVDISTDAITALRAAITEAEKQEPVVEIGTMRIGDTWYKTQGGYLMGEIPTPQPAIPEGWQLVPTKDTDAAKEIVSLAFNEAMSIQAGELGPITLRQKNAIHAIVWDVIDAMIAAAPKPGEKE